jgi:6-phosphogluconate dehydrogenase
MKNRQPQQRSEIGVVGLVGMGRNLLLNMAEHGFSLAGYDMDLSKVEALRQESKQRDVHGVANNQDFIALLRQPRAVVMLVPASHSVDSVINDLPTHRQPDDFNINAGNCCFKDTDVRARNLTAKGMQFFAVGVSGGEGEARHVPSIMPGGPKVAYERFRPVLETVAARVNDDSSVTYSGRGSSGHFVKMVHSEINYEVMQLLAEIYNLPKLRLGMNDDNLHGMFNAWNKGELNGCLLIA